ncbi:hypothetical protein HK102_014126, partial [Quaeritorhiza haematococci]
MSQLSSTIDKWLDGVLAAGALAVDVHAHPLSEGLEKGEKTTQQVRSHIIRQREHANANTNTTKTVVQHQTKTTNSLEDLERMLMGDDDDDMNDAEGRDFLTKEDEILIQMLMTAGDKDDGTVLGSGTGSTTVGDGGSGQTESIPWDFATRAW